MQLGLLELQAEDSLAREIWNKQSLKVSWEEVANRIFLYQGLPYITETIHTKLISQH